MLFLGMYGSIYCQNTTVQTIGLFINNDDAYEGYTLFSPTAQKETFLINNAGKLVHSWQGISVPGHTVYLNEDGTLYRTGRVDVGPIKTHINAGGAGGRIERYGWDSELIWEYEYADLTKRQHHDFQVLPNGNVLILAWEVKTREEAIQAGRNPDNIDVATNELWPDHVVEVAPEGSSGGTIVWEWHVWDHLIQDYDATKDNYGVVEDHPELVDVNFVKPSSPSNPDWNHMNAIDYNPTLDQIVLSVHAFGELWIIDHSTNLEESSNHTGGNSEKGGDLLYRWGNPKVFRRNATDSDRKFFNQHNVHWIPEGLPNEGRIVIFNNGKDRPEGDYSSVEILDPVLDGAGNYLIGADGTFEPLDVVFEYTAVIPAEFFAPRFSSAQQLPNGNMLICNGPFGTFFEIDELQNVVWKYVNPVTPDDVLTQGESPTGVNSVFHILRLGLDYPAFEGKVLEAGEPLELGPDVETVTGIYENDLKILLIYPNPVQGDVVTIKNYEGLIEVNIDIYDAFGNRIGASIIEKTDRIQLHFENLEAGVYFVRYGERVLKFLKL